MKPLIIYYTFSGRTKRVAKIIGDTLAIHEPNYLAIEIKGKFMKKFEMMDALENGDYSSIAEDLKELESMDFDTLVIGMPTWGNRTPKAFNEVIARLPSLENKRVFLFTTSILTGGGTLKYMEEKVRSKGGTNVASRKFRAVFWIRKNNVMKFAAEMGDA